jgi:membrane protease YdiL (CAAX protease family)
VNDPAPASGGEPPIQRPPASQVPPRLDTPATTPHRLRWYTHLLLIGAYPLVVGAIAFERFPARGPALTHHARGLLLVCLLELLIFGAVFAVAWLASRASPDDLLLRLRPRRWAIIPLGLGYSLGLRVALAFAVLIAAAFLIALRLVSLDSLQHFALANRPDVETLVDVSAMRRDPLYFWLTLTLVSFVVAGLREELWRSAFLGGMRVLWPRHFGSRLGQFAAVGLAAIVFGLGHLPQGPAAVGLTGLLGFGLGAIMVLHRSIWPAVAAHGAFDATSMALLPWVLDQVPRLA